MISLLLMRQIAELFLMIGMGFAIVKSGQLRSEDSRVLSVVAVYIMIPCVILKSFQIDFTPQVRQGFTLAVISAVIIHILLILICGLLEKLFHLSGVEKDAIIYSNCGNLLIPLVTAVFGQEWLVYCSAYICVQILFIWTHGQMVMSGERRLDVKKIFMNPNMIASLIGIVMLVTGLRLPALVDETLGTISGSFGAVCMFMIGMLLAGVEWKKLFLNRRIYLMLVLKMLLVPGLILLFCKYVPLKNMSPDGVTIMLISLLAVTAPTATTIPQMAQIFRQDSEYAGAINVLTTLSCIATMPFMVFLYGL